MITTVRVPLRICLGGGGTDLPEFSTRFPGFVVSATINKFITITVRPRADNKVRFFWDEYEEVDDIHTTPLQHQLLPNAMKRANWWIKHHGVDVAALSDMPPQSGMGSSGSFLVGALKALSHDNPSCDWWSTNQLAEEAYNVEREMLGRRVGRQDHYIAAFGGCRAFTFGPHVHPDNTTIRVTPVLWTEETKATLESRLGLYWTGVRRDASQQLTLQADKLQELDEATIQRLKRTSELGHVAFSHLISGDLDGWAAACHEHSQLKQALSGESPLDEHRRTALLAGAKAAKLVGAGAGGYLLCYAHDITAITEVMKVSGLPRIPFKFHDKGVEVL